MIDGQVQEGVAIGVGLCRGPVLEYMPLHELQRLVVTVLVGEADSRRYREIMEEALQRIGAGLQQPADNGEMARRRVRPP